MANSAVVGLLRVLLTANTAEYETAMKKASDSAKKFSKDFDQIGQAASSVGSTLTKAITLPLIGLGTASAKAAIDFQSSFAGVRKTVDATEEEFQQMEQGFRDLAKTIPVNVNELNRLGEAAGALGTPKEEIVDFVRVMALLGQTTNVTSDQAAEDIAKIHNIFGAAGKETENFASALVALGNDGASTESQILSMATRIAGAGNTIGLTQGQVLAFASALSSVGIEAEMGGSAISRVFIDIAAAVNEGGKAVEDFAKVAGQPVEKFSRLFREDAATAVREFINGLSLIKQSGGDLIGTLDALGFSEIRVRDTLLRTAGAGKLLGEALDLQAKAWRDNTALTEEAQKRFETVESELTTLWNRIKDVGITIGNALLPAIQSAVKFADVLLPLIEMLARAFGELPGPIQLGVIAIGALAAAAGPLLYVFGQLMQSAAGIAAAFGKKGVATKLLAGELVTLTGISSALRASLIGLGQAAGVAAAAFVGWQIGKLIADLTGLDKKIADTITGMQNLDRARQLTAQGRTDEAQAQVTKQLAELEEKRSAALWQLNFVLAAVYQKQIDALKQDQTRLAMLDTINKAIQQGADKNITYAEAIKFNEQKLKEWQATAKGATQEVQKATPAAEGLSRALAQTSDNSKKAASALSEVKTETRETADAMQEAFRAMMADAGREAMRLVREMERSGEEAGRRFVEGLNKSNTEFLSTVTDLQRRWILLDEDSVERRQRLIRLEFDQKRSELNRYGTFYEDHLALLNAEETKALQEAEQAYGESLERRTAQTRSFAAEMREILASIPGELVRALETGDFRGAFENIAANIGSLIGGKIGSLFGPAGEMIGSELGRLAGVGFSKLWDRFFGSRGRDLVEEFAASMGGFDALRRRLNALGAEGERLWRNLTQGVGRNNPQQAQAAIDAITAALGRLEQREQAFNQGLSSRLQRLIELGAALPESIASYLEQLRNAGQLTEENIALLEQIAGSGLPTWEQMQAAAEKYGISLDGLGERFNAEKMHAGWQQILDDIDLLLRGGADLTAVLSGASDEISEMVQQSMRAGVAIPENFRPWIEQLIDMGMLVDENGEKIEDIGQLTFGETLQTSVEKLTAEIQQLIRTLGGVPAAIDQIPTEVNVDVNYREGPRPKINEGGWEPGDEFPVMDRLAFARGGMVPQYAAAGRIISGAFSRGTDTVPAMLTPGEVVLNEGQQGNVAAALDGAMRFVQSLKTDLGEFAARAMSDVSPLKSVTVLEVDKRELGRAVADVLPGELRRLGVRVRST